MSEHGHDWVKTSTEKTPNASAAAVARVTPKKSDSLSESDSDEIFFDAEESNSPKSRFEKDR